MSRAQVLQIDEGLANARLVSNITRIEKVWSPLASKRSEHVVAVGSLSSVKRSIRITDDAVAIMHEQAQCHGRQAHELEPVHEAIECNVQSPEAPESRVHRDKDRPSAKIHEQWN